MDNAASNDNDFAIPTLFTFPSSRTGNVDCFMMPSGVDWQIRKSGVDVGGLLLGFSAKI